MIGKIVLYFKIQAKLLIALAFLCIIPLWGFYKFSTIEFDNFYIVSVALLIIIRLLWQGEDAYRKKIKEPVVDRLQKELGKRPNTDQIVKRTNEYVESREFAFIFTGAIVFIIAISFGKI